MTSNQIAYWKLQEDRRANVARETENSTHNRADEDIRRSDIAEKERHNRVSESETNRSNLQNESIAKTKNLLTRQSNAEAARHNRATESNDSNRVLLMNKQADETARANRAKEALTNKELGIKQQTANEQGRHNQAQEKIGAAGVAANIYGSSVGALSRVIPKRQGGNSYYGKQTRSTEQRSKQRTKQKTSKRTA